MIMSGRHINVQWAMYSIMTVQWAMYSIMTVQWAMYYIMTVQWAMDSIMTVQWAMYFIMTVQWAMNSIMTVQWAMYSIMTVQWAMYSIMTILQASLLSRFTNANVVSKQRPFVLRKNTQTLPSKYQAVSSYNGSMTIIQMVLRACATGSIRSARSGIRRFILLRNSFCLLADNL